LRPGDCRQIVEAKATAGHPFVLHENEIKLPTRRTIWNHLKALGSTPKGLK
jgi:hypothetical protein